MDLCPPPVKKRDPTTVPDIRWWYKVSPSGDGTMLEHGFRVTPPRGAVIPMRLFYLATRRPARIRRGMRSTLRNIGKAVLGG